jgi:hypothetical protein
MRFWTVVLITVLAGVTSLAGETQVFEAEAVEIVGEAIKMAAINTIDHGPGGVALDALVARYATVIPSAQRF